MVKFVQTNLRNFWVAPHIFHGFQINFVDGHSIDQCFNCWVMHPVARVSTKIEHEKNILLRTVILIKVLISVLLISFTELLVICSV
jgi:hypothetical protein